METPAELIPIKFLPALVDVERRADGTLILRSPEQLRSALDSSFFRKWETDTKSPEVSERVQAGLAALRDTAGGSSTYATRAMLLQEPPSIDAGEITDKGYI